MCYIQLCFVGVNKLKTPSNTPAHQLVDSFYILFYRKSNDDGLLEQKCVACWGKYMVLQSVGVVSSIIYYATDAQLNIPRRMLKFTLKLTINVPTCFCSKMTETCSSNFNVNFNVNFNFLLGIFNCPSVG